MMKEKYKVGQYALDTSQRKVLQSSKNILVIAGAGSGKTLTIIAKTNYLIKKNNIKPEEILIISFTNSSVNDLKAKIKWNCDIFTFHKLAIKILEYSHQSFSIVSPDYLEYITAEYLTTCEKKEQKTILRYLNIPIPYYLFLKSKYFQHFVNFICSIINYYKTNDYNFETISKIKLSKAEKNILLIIFKIYKTYIEEKNSTCQYDFDDLIIKATLNAVKSNLPYKYIIIDEFQDTSTIRLNLINSICRVTNAKIIVVGDDWQSIYRFSGCNLNIFLNFTDYYPNSEIVKLTNTYRNSQELINIATKFITKNPIQINKTMISSKHIKLPIELVPYKSKSKSLRDVLDSLLQISDDIIIISRNNNDIYEYLDNTIVFESDKSLLIYNNNTIPYYTIHKSKGLEAQYVIVLNCDNDLKGFPNKIEGNKLLNKLFSTKEMKYAEERRLFYVALTRCKEKVYLLYKYNKPSIFIKEIKKIIKANK